MSVLCLQRWKRGTQKNKRRHSLAPEGFRANPEHSTTGRRGYLGKRGSLSERAQRRKTDPRSLVIWRAFWQSRHNPTRRSSTLFS